MGEIPGLLGVLLQVSKGVRELVWYHPGNGSHGSRAENLPRYLQIPGMATYFFVLYMAGPWLLVAAAL